MAWYNSGDWDDGSIDASEMANLLHEICTAVQDRSTALGLGTIAWPINGHATSVENPTVANFKGGATGDNPLALLGQD